MIHPRVVGFHSPDIELAIGPSNPQDFFVLVEMDIGDEEAADIYFAIVATTAEYQRNRYSTA